MKLKNAPGRKLARQIAAAKRGAGKMPAVTPETACAIRTKKHGGRVARIAAAETRRRIEATP